MESIRILQDTYELLYALSFPMGKYLDSHMLKLNSNWFKEMFLANEKTQAQFHGKTCASDLDIYFQAKIFKNYWFALQKQFPDEYKFYNTKNKYLISDIQDIRNNIMHVDHSDYSYADFLDFQKKIKDAANLFNTDLEMLINELHYEEKNKLLIVITREVLNPAIQCKNLNEDIKASVSDTLNRLSAKSSAREIHDFFIDALKAKKGKEVYAELKKCGLKGFEDIIDLIDEAYYS